MLTPLLVLAFTSGASSEFSFATPAGWHQVSPDFSSLERQGVSPELARLARRPDYALFAVGPTGGEHCPPTMAASILPGSFHVTNRALVSVLSGIRESTARAGVEVKVRDATVVEHDGKNIGVIRSSASLSGCPYEQIMYLLPGASHMAQVVFSATPADLPAIEHIAEATAFRTGGLSDDAILARVAAGLAFDNPGDRNFALGFVAGVFGVCAAGTWLAWRMSSGGSPA